MIRVADFEKALDVANGVDYGLSVTVVTQDITEANRFVDDIEASVVKVNEKTTGLELHVPFGGYKDSSTNLVCTDHLGISLYLSLLARSLVAFHSETEKAEIC